MLSRTYASEWESICNQQDDDHEQIAQISHEIEQDCLAGNGTEHLDLDDIIYEHRNTISKILVEYNRLLRPSDECAKELITLLSNLHEQAINKAAEHDFLWSH